MKKSFLIAMVACLVIVGAFAFSTTLTSAANNETTYARVYVMNTLPSVTDVTASPDPASPSDTMTVEANVSDANGDLDVVWAEYYNTTGLVATVGLVLNATSGLYYNDTFQLASNAVPGTWNVTVYANDTYGESSNFTTFVVEGIVALELYNTPVDFGNASAGDSDRRAENGTAVAGSYQGIVAGFPLQVNNTGNVNEDYSISGLDLVGQTDSNFNISVGNVEYNLTDTNGAGFSLTDSEVEFASTNAPQSIQDVYFWINVPSVPQQEYKGNVTIRATQSP